MEIEKAIEKIDKEVKKFEIKGVLSDWADLVIDLATSDPEIRDGIERHSIDELMGTILKSSFKTKEKIDDRIVKAAGLRPPVYIGVPSKAQVKKWIKEVYTK